MTPEQRLRLLELEKEKRRRASAGRESEGSDDSEGEPNTPPPSLGQRAKEGAQDFAAGASRWATLGLDDVASGVLTGALEAASPTSLSDEGDSVATRFRKGQRAGVDDRRKLVDEAAKRSPTAYNTGAGAGAGLSVALAPGGTAARLLMGGLAAPGLADIDLDTPQAPAAAALGIGGGEVANKVLPPAIGAAGRLAGGLKDAAVNVVRSAPGAVRTATAAARPVAAKAGSTIDAIADLVPESLLPAAARRSAAALKELGLPPAHTRVAPAARAKVPAKSVAGYEAVDEATTAPVGELSDDELRLILDDLVGGDLPDAPVTAPVDVPPAAASSKAVAPAAAQPLSDAEMAALLGQTRSTPQYRRAEQVAQSMPRAPGQAFDPLDDISKRAIRQGSQNNMNPVAVSDDITRTPKVVAAVGQQERWRGIYDSLTPQQRPAYIDQLRRESGLTDDQVRRRLKLTLAEWRRLSFSR